MTESVQEQEQTGVQGNVQPVERGRYAVFQAGGGAFIARAVDLCDDCLNCRCGTQLDPIDFTPAGIMKLIRERGLSLPNPLEMMKAMRNGR